MVRVIIMPQSPPWVTAGGVSWAERIGGGGRQTIIDVP